MELRVITTKEEFLACKEKWNRICDRMPDATPFQSWEWNYYWWSIVESGIPELQILEAHISGDSYGFAPIIVKNREVSFIGDVHFDYGQFICAQKKHDTFQTFFRYLIQFSKEYSYQIHLRCIPQNCNQFFFYKEFAEQQKNTLLLEQVETANINFLSYANYEEYVATLGKSIRKKCINRCDRESFGFKIEPFSDQLWNDIIDIYADRQADRVGNSNLLWAKELIHRLSDEGLIQIYTLHYNLQRVAYGIAFFYHNCFFFWLTAFRKVIDYSVGQYTKNCLIKKCFESHVDKLDFMRGAYEYKREWDCNVSYNYELIVFRNCFRKYTYRLKRWGRKKIKAMVYHNPVLSNFYKKHRK